MTPVLTLIMTTDFIHFYVFYASLNCNLCCEALRGSWAPVLGHHSKIWWWWWSQFYLHTLCFIHNWNEPYLLNCHTVVILLCWHFHFCSNVSPMAVKMASSESQLTSKLIDYWLLIEKVEKLTIQKRISLCSTFGSSRVVFACSVLLKLLFLRHIIK